jgi:predicted permease
MGLFRRIVTLGRRTRMEREIEAELREHMQMCIDDNVAAGMSRKAAEREARLRFGSPVAARERVSEEDAALGLESVWRDVRMALRGFVKSPGFSIVVVATLALGIGANTAIFELLDAVRLRTLPVSKPDELAELQIVGGNRGFGLNEGMFMNFTIPMWLEVKDHHDPFSGVFAWRANGMEVGKPGESRQVRALEVSGGFFSTLGVTPWQGRLIEPQDEAGCQLTKVVASYGFWKSQMGGVPITANTTIVVEGKSVQVLGATPPSFFGMEVGNRFDLAYPTCTPAKLRRDIFFYSVMGRLKPGWSVKQANDYFNALSPGLFENTAPTGYSADAVKTYTSFRLGAYPAGAGVSYLREAYSSSLNLLLAITGLVLLIACANLANLMLARSSRKQREIAIRMALGATRARLLRQMLVESALLALLGAGLGVVLAQPLSRALVASLSTNGNSIHLTIAADWRVLLFAAGVGVATCILCGTVPAFRSSKTEPVSAMRSGERGVMGNRERFWMQRAMVVTQVAVSMVLLVGALLFVRSYRNLVTLNPGFRESGVVLGCFGFGHMHLKQENIAAFKRTLVEDVQTLPGIENATATNNVPLTGGSWSHTVDVGALNGSSRFTYVSPSYFATLGIPILTGRGFTSQDRSDTPLALIVNQAFIRQFVRSTSPVGQRVHVRPEPDYPERTYEIVGTVPDTKYFDLRGEAPPIAFVPAEQFPVTGQRPGMAMMIAARDTAGVERSVRQMFEQKHPGLNMQFANFEQGIRDNLVGDRLMAMVSGAFGVLAALLVVIGLYGVLSYFLAQRRGEIGIRIALGASRSRVVGESLWDAGKMLGIGLIMGVMLALVAGREASTMVFGLKPWDPATLIGAAALLAVVTVVTSIVPALKAANVNPIETLRSE